MEFYPSKNISAKLDSERMQFPECVSPDTNVITSLLSDRNGLYAQYMDPINATHHYVFTAAAEHG